MGCGASKKSSKNVIEPAPQSTKDSNPDNIIKSKNNLQNKNQKASGEVSNASPNIPKQINKLTSPPVTESQEEEIIKSSNQSEKTSAKANNSVTLPSPIPQVLLPIDRPQLTDMNGEPLNGKRLPKLNAVDPTNKILPPKAKPLAFEVNMTRKKTNKRSPIQERLESNNKTQMTAEEIQRKQVAANERRLKQQNDKIKKAQEALADIPEKKQKLKELEDKKTEELKLFLTEKRKIAESNKILMENESKKRATKELMRTQEIQMKAKMRKLEEGVSVSNSVPNSIPGTRASSPSKNILPDDQVIPTHLPKSESAPQLNHHISQTEKVQANTEDVAAAALDSLAKSDSLVIQRNFSQNTLAEENLISESPHLTSETFQEIATNA